VSRLAAYGPCGSCAPGDAGWLEVDGCRWDGRHAVVSAGRAGSSGSPTGRLRGGRASRVGIISVMWESGSACCGPEEPGTGARQALGVGGTRHVRGPAADLRVCRRRGDRVAPATGRPIGGLGLGGRRVRGRGAGAGGGDAHGVDAVPEVLVEVCLFGSPAPPRTKTTFTPCRWRRSLRLPPALADRARSVWIARDALRFGRTKFWTASIF
jgi:hypothetical protein